MVVDWMPKITTWIIVPSCMHSPVPDLGMPGYRKSEGKHGDVAFNYCISLSDGCGGLKGWPAAVGGLSEKSILRLQAGR